jgi:predicted O-linked N-acetylglucosamine transferase (SPINDLY family)
MLASLRPIYRVARTRARIVRDILFAHLPASLRPRRDSMQHKTARTEANHVLAAEPRNPHAWRKLGNAQFGLERYPEAIAAYDKALAVLPDDPVIWGERAAALAALKGQPSPPIADEELARDPSDGDGWTVRAGALLRLGRFSEAAAASDRALEFDAGNMAAARVGIQSRLNICDWRRRDEDDRLVAAALRAGLSALNPLTIRIMRDSDEEHFIAARQYARAVPPLEAHLWRGEQYRHDKIRIAYVSADFVTGPVASLIVGCFEHHDRTLFETTAISLRPSDGSETRLRIEAAFDRFLDAHAMPNGEIAKILRELEIDIAINLNGYPGHPSGGVFAHRAVPVQVNYLGYPGTTGAPFMDYIVADEVVIPHENQTYYTEKVAYLPHCYLPNDANRVIAKRKPARGELGLPEKGFVFACFHDKLKMNPMMFGVWMRVLQAIEDSVLWLRFNTAATIANLRREAQARGVAPERLVFARRLPGLEDYLAALSVADLFLDGHPYNAHSTACDALWAGVPVLTYRGRSFSARVGASVLCAVGLPEQVTSSLDEYEKRALALARDPQRLAALKAKLMRNRDTEPLFDTTLFTRDLEAAYRTMWKHQQLGLPPESFRARSDRTEMLPAFPPDPRKIQPENQ